MPHISIIGFEYSVLDRGKRWYFFVVTLSKVDQRRSVFIFLLPTVAVVISLFALYFSWQQSHDIHNQLLLSMKPSLNFMVAEDADDLPVGISIENAGPGPARIKSITWFVDRKPFDDVNKAMDLESMVDVHSLEIDEGDTLGVGETDWLLKYSKKPHGREEEEEINNFIDRIDHTAVEVEFCPVLGNECGKKCSTKGWCE
jgi:hypothetical protein